MTLAIIVVGYKLLFVENKEQFKQYLKIAGIRIIGILIPVLIMFIYLISLIIFYLAYLRGQGKI